MNNMPQCPECGEYEDILALNPYTATVYYSYQCTCGCKWNEHKPVIEVVFHGTEYYRRIQEEKEKEFKQVLHKIQDIEG